MWGVCVSIKECGKLYLWIAWVDNILISMHGHLTIKTLSFKVSSIEFFKRVTDSETRNSSI